MNYCMIKAKKSLGQNFLHAKGVLNKIISCSNLAMGNVVLEVGPGKGALTEQILQTGAQVIAIEKDARLIEFLNEKFEDQIKNKQLILLEGDALEFDAKKLKLKKYKVLANIPYYITGALLRIFFEQAIKPTSVTVLVQKEVADRIVAKGKNGKNKESLLSLAIKFYGMPKKIMNVSKNSFNPAPKVDSAVLFIETFDTKVGLSAELKNKAKFFDLIHRGFAHKRKVLRKNLIDSGLPSDLVDGAFAGAGLDAKARAEDLHINDWLSLVEKLY